MAHTFSREYDLKAAFLYNFSAFVEWPDSAFARPDSPFVIGVLGADPFGTALDEIVAGEHVNGRPVVVERFNRPEGTADCQIVFISSSERRRLREILHYFRNRPVLTVADMPNFVDEGGSIGFTAGLHVGIKINPDPLRAAHLSMSPKLLRLAEVVARSTPP